MIRIILADDQTLVRGGFRMILSAEDDMTVVGEAEDGGRAIELTRQLKPDVVLLDVRMPHVDGIAAAEQILALDSAPRVLILTTFDLDEYVYASLRIGVSGFLLKTVEPSGLVEAVRTIVAGHMLVAPEVTRSLVEAFVGRRKPDGSSPLLTTLTDRERDVVRLIAKGLSNQEIANELYLSESTIKSHVVRVLSKLHLRDRVQVVVAAYESGLVLPGE